MKSRAEDIFLVQLVKNEIFAFYPRFSLIHDLYLLRKEGVRKYTVATEPFENGSFLPG